MTVKEELTAKVNELATTPWGDITNAYVLPTVDDLTFGNSGERLDVTALYADISASTEMVNKLSDTHAAEYYKAFLHCASQLVKKNNGEIQAYDGDRVMAMYVGENQADNAVGSAFEIHYAVSSIINPIFERVYGLIHREIRFTVGIDSGRALAIKVGVRAVGEVAWIGGAANYAAKLNSFEGIDHTYPIRVTKQTMDKMTFRTINASDGSNMWEGPYNNLKARLHYRTSGFRVLP